MFKLTLDKKEVTSVELKGKNLKQIRITFTDSIEEAGKLIPHLYENKLKVISVSVDDREYAFCLHVIDWREKGNKAFISLYGSAEEHTHEDESQKVVLNLNDDSIFIDGVLTSKMIELSYVIDENISEKQISDMKSNVGNIISLILPELDSPLEVFLMDIPEIKTGYMVDKTKIYLVLKASDESAQKIVDASMSV